MDNNDSGVDPWLQTQKIEQKVAPLSFADYKLVVTDFGAIADGTTLNTIAINAAIDKCAAEGGGYLIVPAGKWIF